MKFGLNNLKIRFTLFFVLFVSALFSVVVITTIQQYNDAASVMAYRLGFPILKRAGAFIDGDKFEKLSRTMDESDPFYEEARLKLAALKKETQCLYLYTMAPGSDDIHFFVIDGTDPEDEDFSPIGSSEDISGYEESYRRTFQERSPQHGNMESVTKWGWVLSSYMPIFNSSGDMVGIIGCDFEARSVYESIQSRAVQQIAFAVIFISVGLVFYFFLLKAVTKQNKELMEMSRKADAASRSKSAFLARMSHEIRTPMNAVIGMSELALRTDSLECAKEYVLNIKRAGMSLLSIINDILDFSKIESGRMGIVSERYDMASLMNDVITIIQVRVAEKQIEFTADIDETIPAFMLGDETRVRQVLLNILSNAVKYTESGFIKFSAHCERHGDDVTLIFKVADSGIGINPDEIHELFGDFSRIDIKRNTKIEGTGLGLAITKEICRALSGDVSVESEYGKGSIFTAVLHQACLDYTPIGQIGSRRADIYEERGANFTAPDFSVLVVDDAATNLMVMEGLLALYDMKVSTCDSGRESVERVRAEKFDLVFMDHMMPDMDGVEATKAIRSAEGGEFKAPPIIALTANAVFGMREMFLENGFSDFLAKPIELPKLHKMLEKWVPKERRAAPLKKYDSAAPSALPLNELEIDGIDNMMKGLAICGSASRYRDTLEIYCRDAESRLKFFEPARDDEALKNLTIHVHALKSASANIGADELSKMAAHLEEAGRNKDTKTISENIDDFKMSVVSIISNIRVALDKARDAANSKSASREEIRGLLEALRENIKAENVYAVDKIIEELNDLTLDAQTRGTVSKIADLVLVSEFKKAADVLREKI